jgi:uncharacterized protein YacL
MIQAISRFTLVIAGLLGGYLVAQTVDWQATQLSGLAPSYVIFLCIILGGSIGFVLGGIIGRELTSAWLKVEMRVADISGVDLILGTAGLLVGLLVAFLASQPLRLLEPSSFAITIMVLLTVVAVYLCVSIAMTRRREFSLLFPALAPGDLVSADERQLVLDTSAVIDSRFVELRRLGFLPGRPKVPRFVLAELQTLADSADDTRRSRGRRGLDLLTTLPAEDAPSVFEIDYMELAAVDDKLMRLCVDVGGALVTVDHNLAKVARVRGIEVLNVNEAAASLRPTFLPGDAIMLHIVKPGKEIGQGVGYLEDGTMVVVQGGRDLVGIDADVEVTSVLQTSSGRMIFARPSDKPESPETVSA